jgi:hypothetical protein
MKYGNELDKEKTSNIETDYILKNIVQVSKLYRSQKIKRRRKYKVSYG